MARNQEKAQSLLYRFREAQAAELGIRTGPKAGQKRPRLASSVKDLRECERWRGDVLREIGRKVGKIQDFGLTDYEVRDLNDEINKLLREKRHWENQLVALGGANYRRSVTSQLDDAGREIPGTRGYKYFGRAKDLPGVKELLERSVRREEEQSEEERGVREKYRRFAGQPPAYWGDEDEDVVDGHESLLEEEERRERQRWEQALRNVGEELEVGEGSSTGEVAQLIGVEADLPRRRATNVREVMARQTATAQGDVEMEENQDEAAADHSDDKKRKSTSTSTRAAKKAKGDRDAQEDGSNSILAQLLPALDPAQLSTPVVPDRAATEAFILRERKRMLREEYSVGGGEKAK